MFVVKGGNPFGITRNIFPIDHFLCLLGTRATKLIAIETCHSLGMRIGQPLVSNIFVNHFDAVGGGGSVRVVDRGGNTLLDNLVVVMGGGDVSLVGGNCFFDTRFRLGARSLFLLLPVVDDGAGGDILVEMVAAGSIVAGLNCLFNNLVLRLERLGITLVLVVIAAVVTSLFLGRAALVVFLVLFLVTLLALGIVLFLGRSFGHGMVIRLGSILGQFGFLVLGTTILLLLLLFLLLFQDKGMNRIS